jgi:hypothetical protein
MSFRHAEYLVDLRVLVQKVVTSDNVGQQSHVKIEALGGWDVKFCCDPRWMWGDNSISLCSQAFRILN